MTPPRALLIDLDDTILVDSLGSDDRYRQTCAELAARDGRCTGEALWTALDGRLRWYWSDPERHRQGRLDLDAARRANIVAALAALDIRDDALAETLLTTYTARRHAAIQPLPGAIDAIERIRAAGVTTALLTNGAAAAQQAKIDRFDLARLFDLVVIEGAFGFGKPEERVYRHALDVLGVRAEETWMVGDNLEWEVLAPRRLGITGVWIDHAGTGVPDGAPEKPAHIIRSLAELVPLVLPQ